MKLSFLNNLADTNQPAKVEVVGLNINSNRGFLYDSVQRKDNRLNFLLDGECQSSLKLNNCLHFSQGKGECSWEYRSAGSDGIFKYSAKKV